MLFSYLVTRRHLNSNSTHSFILCSVLPEEMDPWQQEGGGKTLLSPTNKMSAQEEKWRVIQSWEGKKSPTTTAPLKSLETTRIPCSFLGRRLGKKCDCCSQAVDPTTLSGSSACVCVCVCVCVRRVWRPLFVVHGKRILASETIPGHSKGDEQT